MYCAKRIAVVVPAFKAQATIGQVIDGMPEFVDCIIVVDDASPEPVSKCVNECADKRLLLLRHRKNEGVGAAITTGYRAALCGKADIVAVMGADGQMLPGELASLLGPIAAGDADYVKGNRFLSGFAFPAMPLSRYVGNVALSLLSKPATGYWELFDSQCGYTAISRETLRRLPLDNIYPRYGVPNDLLARLHRIGARVVEMPVTPVYTGQSQMKLVSVAAPIGWLLLRLFLLRLARKVGHDKPLAAKLNDALR